MSDDGGPDGHTPVAAAADCVAGDAGAVSVSLGMRDWNLVVQVLDQRARYSALSGLGAAYSSVADLVAAQLPNQGSRPADARSAV